MKILKTDKLHGDASYRVYYRLTMEGGGTMILMQMPEGKASASEEITNLKEKLALPPFIDVANLLAKNGIRVPQVLHHDPVLRQITLEDLGDDLMINHINDKDVIGWYKKAIDVMKRIHSVKDDGSSVAFRRSFDATLLNWEFDHFREFLVEARNGEAVTPADKRSFEEITRAITKEITKMTQTLTHRDFQSRNLIALPDSSLAVIDFQDALIGPYIYDLVSLLRDSYVSLSWADTLSLIKYFDSSPSAVIHFHLVTLQRKMKDAGRFVYIERVKGNPNYLKFIPASLGYIKFALHELKKYNELEKLIKKWVPEWEQI